MRDRYLSQVMATKSPKSEESERQQKLAKQKEEKMKSEQQLLEQQKEEKQKVVAVAVDTAIRSFISAHQFTASKVLEKNNLENVVRNISADEANVLVWCEDWMDDTIRMEMIDNYVNQLIPFPDRTKQSRKLTLDETLSSKLKDALKKQLFVDCQKYVNAQKEKKVIEEEKKKEKEAKVAFHVNGVEKKPIEKIDSSSESESDETNSERSGDNDIIFSPDSDADDQLIDAQEEEIKPYQPKYTDETQYLEVETAAIAQAKQSANDVQESNQQEKSSNSNTNSNHYPEEDFEYDSWRFPDETQNSEVETASIVENIQPVGNTQRSDEDELSAKEVNKAEQNNPAEVVAENSEEKQSLEVETPAAISANEQFDENAQNNNQQEVKKEAVDDVEQNNTEEVVSEVSEENQQVEAPVLDPWQARMKEEEERKAYFKMQRDLLEKRRIDAERERLARIERIRKINEEREQKVKTRADILEKFNSFCKELCSSQDKTWADKKLAFFKEAKDLQSSFTDENDQLDEFVAICRHFGGIIAKGVTIEEEQQKTAAMEAKQKAEAEVKAKQKAEAEAEAKQNEKENQDAKISMQKDELATPQKILQNNDLDKQKREEFERNLFDVSRNNEAKIDAINNSSEFVTPTLLLRVAFCYFNQFEIDKPVQNNSNKFSSELMSTVVEQCDLLNNLSEYEKNDVIKFFKCFLHPLSLSISNKTSYVNIRHQLDVINVELNDSNYKIRRIKELFLNEMFTLYPLPIPDHINKLLIEWNKISINDFFPETVQTDDPSINQQMQVIGENLNQLKTKMNYFVEQRSFYNSFESELFFDRFRNDAKKIDDSVEKLHINIAPKSQPTVVEQPKKAFNLLDFILKLIASIWANSAPKNDNKPTSVGKLNMWSKVDETIDKIKLEPETPSDNDNNNTLGK